MEKANDPDGRTLKKKVNTVRESFDEVNPDFLVPLLKQIWIVLYGR